MPTLICPDVLIDGTGVEAQRNACVVIEDERIVFVGTRQELDSAFPVSLGLGGDRWRGRFPHSRYDRRPCPPYDRAWR